MLITEPAKATDSFTNCDGSIVYEYLWIIAKFANFISSKFINELTILSERSSWNV